MPEKLSTPILLQLRQTRKVSERNIYDNEISNHGRWDAFRVIFC